MRKIWIGVFLGGWMIISSGCGMMESDDPDWADECSGVAYDQKRSFMAPVNLDDGSIQVWIDPRFDSQQSNEILRAVETWNQGSRQMTGKTLFSPRVSTVVGKAVPGHSEDCTFVSANGARAFWVVHERSPSVWQSLGLVNHNPAATVRCTQGKELTKQVVVLNPELVPAQQLMSVMLHELGHSLGLKHSCDENNSGDPRHIGCGQLAQNHPYLQAVMFWKLGIDGHSIRESLGANDKERAYCLYR